MADQFRFGQIEKLREEIRLHNHHYYVLDSPLITDANYDELMGRLRALEQSRPEFITQESPTQRVGAAPSTEFREVVHAGPMLSLANAFSELELLTWHRRASELLEISSFRMVCEPKIDGLAVALTYEDGKLVRGATRGDGLNGENVTANVRTIDSVPLVLRMPNNVPGLLEVRGEVYFPLEGFRKLNQERADRGEALYANPRNSAAGSLRQLDPRITASRPLDLFVYQLGSADDSTYPNSHWEILHWLRELGFRVNPDIELVESPEAVIAYHTKWSAERDRKDYQTDGIVAKVDRIDYQGHMGVAGREPRWAIAFKFPSEQVVTRLLDIGVNVGRTGSLNPYAILDPVRVSGVIVKQASLHNEADIQRKDIRIGDYVVVERAGEVIPQVVGPLHDRRTGLELPFEMPTYCPVCGGVISLPTGEATHRCTNSSCAAQIFERIRHFVSQEAMDIRGLGGKLVETLLATGLVREMSDIYALTKEQILSLDRIGEKSADNLLVEIQLSKSRPFPRVISALGILHVGTEIAELLAQHFGNMEGLIQADTGALEGIPGVGSKLARSITGHFEQAGNIRIIERLRGFGVSMEFEGVSSDIGKLPLSGKRIVVTGRLNKMTRLQFEARVKELGGRLSANVTKSTDYLVSGAEPGSKYDDATILGIAIISEDDFEQMIRKLT